MPLVLDTPTQVTVTTVKITSFNFTVNPEICQIVYVEGYETPDGFVQVGNNTATYNQEQIAAVDPDGTIYSSMKDALYQLLETTVGPGTVD